MKKIRLSRGEFALVDDEDYEILSQYSWHANKGGYALGSIPTGKRGAKHVLMHRLIMNAPNGTQVDHKDGNPLNNQKINLRIVTHSENCRNSIGHAANRTSQYKGVQWDKQIKRWRVYIRVDSKQLYGGVYRNEEDAARAYDHLATKHYKDFACLNFPDTGEVATKDWHCALCDRNQGVVEFQGLYEQQVMKLCLACVRLAAREGSNGDRFVRSPKAQRTRGVPPTIKRRK